jgi:hypothetical protein
MAMEDAEVAALDRVLTRTVLTKDEELQQVGLTACSGENWAHPIYLPQQQLVCMR